MSAKTVCSGSPNPSTKLVVQSPTENKIPAEFVAEEATTRSPAAKESKKKHSCCMKICLSLTSCCRRNPTSLSQENNNSEKNRPKNPSPANELRFLTNKRECATDIGDGSRDTKKKRIFRRLFPCCSTSKLPKQKNCEVATPLTPIMDVAMPEFPTICVSGEDRIGVDSQSSIETIETIEKNRNAPEISQEVEPASDNRTSCEEAGLYPKSQKIDPAPEETKIGTETTPKFPLEGEKDEKRKVYGPPTDGGFFLHLLDLEETRLKNRMELASGRMENLEDGCEEAGKIRVAIGKGNLLISKKFKQFRELCRTNVQQNAGAPIPESDAGPTLDEDLEGFWELLLMQVQLIDDMLNNTEAAPIPKAKVPAQKKQTRKYAMTASDSTPKPVDKSKKASDRDETRRRMLAERRAAMKKLSEDSSNPRPEHEVENETNCAISKSQSDEEHNTTVVKEEGAGGIQEESLIPNLEILNVGHNENEVVEFKTVVQNPDEIFAAESESFPIGITELTQYPDQLENRQFAGKYFEATKEVEDYFYGELDKLEKLLDSSTPDAARGQIIESMLEELESLQKRFCQVVDSASGENAPSSEQSEGPNEVLVSGESSPQPEISQDESGVNQTQAQLQHNSKEQESRDEGANNSESKPDPNISEELQKYLEQELDKLEDKLNVISSEGIGSNSQGEIEAVLRKLDELEAECHPIFSQAGETKFAALHRLCAPKDRSL